MTRSHPLMQRQRQQQRRKRVRDIASLNRAALANLLYSFTLRSERFPYREIL